MITTFDRDRYAARFIDIWRQVGEAEQASPPKIADMARGISNIARQATRIGVEEQQIKARLSKGDSTRIAWYFIS